MFPSMKCTQTFVNGPLMSVLSKDGGLTFVHVTQRTAIPISLQVPPRVFDRLAQNPWRVIDVRGRLLSTREACDDVL